VRSISLLAASVGLLLCIATASTGIWFGLGHVDIKEIHLKLAVGCVTVSTVAHVLNILMCRRAKS
jgi:hypothetical protein